MTSPALAQGPPPRLSELAPVSLFVDFDGTLVDLIDNPDDILVDDALSVLLAGLSAALPGRVALISGRSIAQLDGFLGPLAARMTLAGSHGVELRRAGGELISPVRLPELDAIDRELAQFAAANPGVRVESKTHGAALHYRAFPQYEAAASAFFRDRASLEGLVVQPGKMMIELRRAGSKGDAVRTLMRDPAMAGATPLFIGDDLTDEDGFSAVRALGGAGVLVAAPRKTAARYRLRDVEAARAWLATALP